MAKHAAAVAEQPTETTDLTTRGTPRKSPDELKIIRRRAAATARAAMAKLRAAGQVSATLRRPDPTQNSLMGRVDRRLAEMGRRRRALEIAMGVSKGVLAAAARTPPERQNFRPENLQKIAAFLGVTTRWLRHGDGAGPDVTQLIPQPVAKANGKHAPAMMNADVSMAASHQSTINTLFPLLPPDVQAYIIARTADLIAMQMKAKD